MGTQLKNRGMSVFMCEYPDPALVKGLKDAHIQVVDQQSNHLLVGAIKRIDGSVFKQIESHMKSAFNPDTLEQRVREVLAFKYWNMQQNHISDKASQKALIRDLYAASLTVLKNQENILPLKELEKTKIASLAVNRKSPTEFQKVTGLYTRTDNYFWKAGMANSEALSMELADYDLVLAGLYPGQDLSDTEAFFRAIAEKTNLVVIKFGDLKVENRERIANLGAIPGLQALILSYETNSMIESLSAQLIFGGIEGSGRLPMQLGDLYPRGSGLNTPGGLRLQYGLPESAGLNSRDLKPAIDSIVKAGLEAEAYPGCQVIVARKGCVVFHKAYGYHTYDKRVEVEKDDLYDLASVTKISGPLSGLMKLETLDKFSYQDQLGNYSQAMKGSDKADLELKDILAHKAGLFPWIPYHELTLKKNGKYKKRFIRPYEGGKFSVEVSDRLYLRSNFKDKIFRTIRKSELGEPVYRYSGLSFFLFPTIIEDISGQPYEEFLSEQIYRPLGAWDLLYRPRSLYPLSRIVPTEIDSVFRKELVHGYVHDEGAAVMGSHAGNAGLFATSNDLLKLIEMYRRMGSYGGEQIIEAEVLKEYTTYQFPELEIRRGLGFDKPLLGERDGTPGDYPCPGASPSSFGHSGFTGTFVWADPEHEITYVFLSNRVFPTRENGLLYDMNIRTSILQSVYDSIVDP
jgi:CubicO group peptidase (beta-lactamase class C family)